MKRIETLTGLRALAALWVVFLHAGVWGGIPMAPIVEAGRYGVDIFFILSGFVISLVHQKDFIQWETAKTARYLLLRIARMYPVHLVMLLTYAAISLAYHAPKFYNNNLKTAAMNLLMLQVLPPAGTLSWNHPAWSISAEWIMYLCFPVVALVFLRLNRAWLNAIVAIGLLVAMEGFRWAVIPGDPKSPGTPLAIEEWQYLWGVARIAFEFGIGCCLYNLYKHNVRIAFNLWAGVALLGLLLAAWVHATGIVMVACATLLVYSLTGVTGLWEKAFSNRPMRYLGEISYSLYMVHEFVFIVLTGIWGLEGIRSVAWFVPGFVVASVLAATVLYTWVEKPSREFLRNWINQRTQNATAIQAYA